MKVTVKREAFIETLGRVKTVVPNKATLAIITKVLLEARDGVVTITGTDLEKVLVGTVRGTVEKAGSVVVPPQQILDFLKVADTDKIELAATVKTEKYKSSNWVPDDTAARGHYEDGMKERKHFTFTVTSGKASVNLTNEYQPKDFPPVPKVTGTALVFPALAEAMRKVIYATAKEESRPVLNGICVSPGKGTIKLAAADGFRLAVSSTHCRGEVPFECVVPLGTCEVILKQFDGRVTFTPEEFKSGDHTGKRLMVQQPGLTLVSQLAGGTYPNYEQLIPKEGKLVKCESEDLRKALKQVGAIKSPTNKVELAGNGRQIIVSANDGDDNEIQVKIPGTGRMKTGYNMKYLAEMLGQLTGTFAMRLGPEQSSPMVAKHDGTIHVLMPMFVT